MGKNNKKRQPSSDSESESSQSVSQSFVSGARTKKNAVKSNTKSVKKKTPIRKDGKDAKHKKVAEKPKPKPKKVLKEDQEKEESDEENGKQFDFMTGQKYPTPDQEDSIRTFYESLYRQKPDSLMAKQYCLEHGILPEKEIKSVMAQISKSKKKR